MDPGGDSGSADEGFVDDSNIEEGMDMVHVVNEDDVDEVLDLGDEIAEGAEEDEVVEGMGEMDLENYDEVEGADAIEPERDDAVRTFDKHSGSVFCVSIDPATEKIAITGGEDDKGYVWKLDSGDVMFQCEGHKDSVTSASFSHDSTFVASGDMSGVLKVWKVESGQEIWSFEVTDLEWMAWHPVAPVLLAGTVDGATWMWKMPSGDCKTFEGHGCACNQGGFMPDGKRACVCYEDGVVKVWDLKSGSALHTFSGHMAHTSSITSIDCHTDNTLVTTGSTDATAKVYNTTTGKVLTTFSCKDNPEEDCSVEAVAFSNTHSLLATGTLTGSMCIWDLSTQKQRHKCVHKAGIVRLKWTPNSPLIYTCCLDGTCNMWDSRTGKMESQWLGHRGEVFDMAVARNSSVLVSASGDSTAKLFSLQKPDR